VDGAFWMRMRNPSMEAPNSGSINNTLGNAIYGKSINNVVCEPLMVEQNKYWVINYMMK